MIGRKRLFDSQDERFLEILHSKYWQKFASHSSSSSPPSLGRDDKDFQLHLYDKLWENIIHKENRLWTFLTVYGAAIGVTIGTGVTETLRFESGLVILVLTYWATEIIIDTDWWSVRNRLMVRGIERRAHAADTGLIPPIYHAPLYSSESLHSISVLVFSLIGLVFLALSLGLLSDDWSTRNAREILWVTGLYAFFLYALFRCAHIRENRIKDFYRAFREINKKERDARLQHVSPLTDEVINKAEQGAKTTRFWRIQAGILYLIATGLVALRYYASLTCSQFALFTIGQALFFMGLCIQTYKIPVSDSYGLSPFKVLTKEHRNCHNMWTVLMLLPLVFSLLVPVWAAKDFTGGIDGKAISTKLAKVRAEVLEVQQQVQALDEVQKHEWEQRFATKSESANVTSKVEQLDARVSDLAKELRRSTASDAVDAEDMSTKLDALVKKIERLERLTDSAR
ncbi:MAG: hypothetical protein L0Z46_09030 [Nitrospiraceae bacterium]|nr:hypothetical protein [Nitrospiraceae bacterium]